VEFAVDFVGIVNLALFATIAAVSVGQLRREQGRRSALWAALAFVALAWVVIASAILPDEPGSFAAKALQRFDLAMLVLFPYFLYRFAASFEESSRPLSRFVGSLTTALLLGALLLPRFFSSSSRSGSGAPAARRRRSPGGGCARSRWRRSR
jgi:uncharacterized membrane protein